MAVIINELEIIGGAEKNESGPGQNEPDKQEEDGVGGYEDLLRSRKENLSRLWAH